MYVTPFIVSINCTTHKFAMVASTVTCTMCKVSGKSFLSIVRINKVEEI